MTTQDNELKFIVTTLVEATLLKKNIATSYLRAIGLKHLLTTDFNPLKQTKEKPLILYNIKGFLNL
jgi:hypothetical protein